MNGNAKQTSNGLLKPVGSYSDIRLDAGVEDDIEGMGGRAGGQQGGEMTWYTFIDHVDRVCFRIFCMLFLSTTVGILLPAYFRKYWSSLSHVSYHGHDPLA